MSLKQIESENNNLEASWVRLLTEYRALCESLKKEKDCYRTTELCYGCGVHFKMSHLMDKLKLYDMELREA